MYYTTEQKPFAVGDSYRTNELSRVAGGFTLTVWYKDGRILVYDKVKNPEAYLRRIPENNVVRHTVSK